MRLLVTLLLLLAAVQVHAKRKKFVLYVKDYFTVNSALSSDWSFTKLSPGASAVAKAPAFDNPKFLGAPVANQSFACQQVCLWGSPTAPVLERHLLWNVGGPGRRGRAPNPTRSNQGVLERWTHPDRPRPSARS